MKKSSSVPIKEKKKGTRVKVRERPHPIPLYTRHCGHCCVYVPDKNKLVCNKPTII